ncbi:MAG: hypothetical protein SPK64_04080 [Candidatus Enterosoma sp.]|nr:hypothetical protein [Candidatus Enterosoma sp.]
MEKITGTVLQTKDEKLLVLANNKYYILKGDESAGDSITFDESQALIMPSYLFAIAALEEDNLTDTLKFIKNQWYK